MRYTNRSCVTTLALLVLGSLHGCIEDQTVNTNTSPVANAGKDQQLDYDGAPVSVRLDGSKSTDADGTIAHYRWRSANDGPDGGAPDAALDPKDVARPTIVLERGTYTFTLWVVDNQGEASSPDSVTINVGTDPVVECAAAIPDVLAPECGACLCGVSDACRKAAAACDETCWELLACIGAMCPDTTDVPCIVAGCPDLLGGGTAAMGLTDCFTPCADACAAASGADAGS